MVPDAPRNERAAVTTRRVLLIIGGGIAAYKSLDLIRRLQDHGATVRCILTKAAQEFVTPLAAGALAGGQVFTDLFDPKSRIRRRPYPARARHRSRHRGARHRRPDGEDGGRPCRRSRDRGAARHRQADPDRAGDEPDDVGAPATQRNLAQLDRRRRRDRRAQCRRDGGARRGRHRPHGGADGDRSRGGDAARRRRRPAPARRQARGHHLGADARADRSGALHRQPFFRQAGPRDRRCGGSSRRRGHPDLRAGQHPRSGRCARPSRSRPRARCSTAVEKAMPADCAIFAAAVADWRVADARREKIKKAKGRNAGAVADREPRHPRHHRAAQGGAPAAGHRLRRRDREPRRQRQGQAQAQGLRLDRRQRRLAGIRRHGRRRQQGASRHRARRRIVAAAAQGRRRARAGRRASRRSSPEDSHERCRDQVARLPHGDGLPLPPIKARLQPGSISSPPFLRTNRSSLRRAIAR